MAINRFHQLMIRIYNLHKKKSQKQFCILGLSQGQPKIIDSLRSMNGCAQKDLAQACEIEPATVTSILNNMEKNGLINRIPEVLESGKRITRIFLTVKGETISQDVENIINMIEDVSLKGFSDDEKAKVIEYLTRIYNNLKSYDSTL